jgi:hypothetical protein
MLTSSEKNILLQAFEKGFDDADIAYYADFKKARVSYWRKKLGFSASDIKDKRWAQWERLAKAGATPSTIALLYRIKEHTVRLRLHLLGLSLRDIKNNHVLTDPYRELFGNKDEPIMWQKFIELP